MVYFNLDPPMVSIQQKTHVGMRSHASYQALPPYLMLEPCAALVAPSSCSLTLYPWICFCFLRCSNYSSALE